MESADLSPLRFNPSTGEPFIPLPAPYNNLILTPPRLSDADANYTMMNDPKIIKTLTGPPYPYLESHAKEWVASITKMADDAMREFREAVGQGSRDQRKLVGTCPVRYIREVNEDGSDILLGDVFVHRCEYPGVLDDAERERLAKENELRELGDPDLAWCIGSK